MSQIIIQLKKEKNGNARLTCSPGSHFHNPVSTWNLPPMPPLPDEARERVKLRREGYNDDMVDRIIVARRDRAYDDARWISQTFPALPGEEQERVRLLRQGYTASDADVIFAFRRQYAYYRDPLQVQGNQLGRQLDFLMESIDYMFKELRKPYAAPSRESVRNPHASRGQPSTPRP